MNKPNISIRTPKEKGRSKIHKTIWKARMQKLLEVRNFSFTHFSMMIKNFFKNLLYYFISPYHVSNISFRESSQTLNFWHPITLWTTEEVKKYKNASGRLEITRNVEVFPIIKCYMWNLLYCTRSILTQSERVHDETLRCAWWTRTCPSVLQRQ